MAAYKDASHLYPVERRARHAVRPGFRISELQIGPTQEIPWHFHHNVQDTFYVLEGAITVSTRDPEASVTLQPGETFAAPAGQPHRVTNAGETSATFFVMQGLGEYDYVPVA